MYNAPTPMKKGLTAAELLKGIPEEWLDVKRRDLEDQTPREAADQVVDTGCRACYYALMGLQQDRNE